MDPLRPHSMLFEDQKKAIMQMVGNPHVALFGGLGTGKTIISLYTINRLLALGQLERVLIIAPIRVCYGVWQDEAAEWEYTQNLRDKFVILHGPDRKGVLQHELTVNKKLIYMANFENVPWICDLMRRYRSKYKKDMFDVLFVDESSKMKSWKTKRFKEIKNLLPEFKRRYILTATPNPNRYLDLWSQFYIVDLGKTLEPVVSRYLARYFTQKGAYVWVPISKNHINVIKSKIAPSTIRISAENRPTPPLLINPVKIHLSPSLMERYQEFEEEYFLEIDEVGIEAFNAASLAMKLRQFVQGSMYYEQEGERRVSHIHDEKLQALQEIIDTNPDTSFLIAIQFRFEMEILRKNLKGVKFIVGGSKAADSSELIKAWNQRKVKYLAVHPLSLSHGVNMQKGGNNLIWYGLPWSLEQFQQLNGRLHRTGQTEKTYAHCLVVQDTIDTAVFRSLKTKDAEQQDLLNYLESYWREKHVRASR